MSVSAGHRHGSPNPAHLNIDTERSAKAEALVILRMGTTVAFNQLAYILIPVATVVMTAWLGVEALAAASLANSAGLLLYLSSLGVLQGLMPVLGAALGARDGAKASAAILAAFALALILGCVTTAIMALLPMILVAANYDTQLISLSSAYIDALLPGYLASAAFVGLRFTLIAAGDLRWLNPIVLTGTSVHILLSYAFITGWLGLPV